jgi:hypothetical protein
LWCRFLLRQIKPTRPITLECHRARARFLKRRKNHARISARREIKGLPHRKNHLASASVNFSDIGARPDVPCDQVVRKLSWTSGHKTKFCRSRGYDGVDNPFGNYSAGGYCFEGDAATCISAIQRR